VECDFVYAFPNGLPVRKPTPKPAKMKKRKKVPSGNIVNSSQWAPTTFYSQFPEKRKWKLKKRARMLLGNLGSAIDRSARFFLSEFYFPFKIYFQIFRNSFKPNLSYTRLSQRPISSLVIFVTLLMGKMM